MKPTTRLEVLNLLLDKLNLKPENRRYLQKIRDEEANKKKSWRTTLNRTLKKLSGI